MFKIKTMKKIILFVTIAFLSLNVVSQETKNKYPQDINKKYELKLNAFSLIVFSSFDVSYEYLLNKNSSFGVSLFYNFNDIDNDLYFPKKFSLTPHYRWFFSETRYARGFFVEGFGMLNTYEDYFLFSDTSSQKETDFALGISVGGKFIIRNGFTAEVLLGIGRNLFKDSNSNIGNYLITRGGISLGYRF